MSAKLELVTDKKTFMAAQMRELLGVSWRTYYRICRSGALRYTRAFPGGPRMHTQKHYDDYVAWLNRNEVAVAPAFSRRFGSY